MSTDPERDPTNPHSTHRIEYFEAYDITSGRAKEREEREKPAYAPSDSSGDSGGSPGRGGPAVLIGCGSCLGMAMLCWLGFACSGGLLWMAGTSTAATNPQEEKLAKEDKQEKPLSPPVRIVRLDRLLYSGGQGPFEAVKRYHIILDRVEYHAEGAVRWHFTIANKSDKFALDQFYQKDSKLVDQDGNACAVTGISVGFKPSNDGPFATVSAKPGEKTEFWVQFSTPKPTAKYLTLHLNSNLRLLPVVVNIPPKTLPDKPPAEPVAEERPDVVKRTAKPSTGKSLLIAREAAVLGGKVPYQVTLERVEWLENGDVRVHLSCWNQPKVAAPQGVRDEFDVQNRVGQTSVLLDARGKTYPLIGCSLGKLYNTIYVDCAPGEKKEFWLEFQGPVLAGKRFTLRLASNPDVASMRLPDLVLSLQ